jgi:hypothetical protein
MALVSSYLSRESRARDTQGPPAADGYCKSRTGFLSGKRQERSATLPFAQILVLPERADESAP